MKSKERGSFVGRTSDRMWDPSGARAVYFNLHPPTHPTPSSPCEVDCDSAMLLYLPINGCYAFARNRKVLSKCASVRYLRRRKGGDFLGGTRKSPNAKCVFGLSRH